MKIREEDTLHNRVYLYYIFFRQNSCESNDRILWFDRRDYSTSSCLPRSSSIDSIAEWGLTGGIGTIDGGNSVNASSSYGLFVEHPIPRRSPSPLLGARSDRLSLVSPNVGRRMKGQRIIVGKLLYRMEIFYLFIVS